MKKYIIPSSIVLLIVVGLLLITFKNTSDQQSVQTQIQTEVKIETNTGKLTTHDILSQLDEEVVVVEIEVDEDNEPEVVPEPEPKIEPVIVEKPKPVIVSVPKPEPKVNTTEPDFQAHEYFRNSEDEAPQVYRYKPKPEWFIPKGNPEDFALNEQNIWNASGINFKHFSLSIKKEYIETELATLEGMTKFLKQYIQQDFYFIGDNEEESQYWKIHVNVNSITEANNLMKEIKQDGNIVYSVYNVGGILPQFKDQEQIIKQKQSEFSEE